MGRGRTAKGGCPWTPPAAGEEGCSALAGGCALGGQFRATLSGTHAPRPVALLLWEKPEGRFLETPSAAGVGAAEGTLCHRKGTSFATVGTLLGRGVPDALCLVAGLQSPPGKAHLNLLLHRRSEPTAREAPTPTGLAQRRGWQASSALITRRQGQGRTARVFCSKAPRFPPRSDPFKCRKASGTKDGGSEASEPGTCVPTAPSNSGRSPHQAGLPSTPPRAHTEQPSMQGHQQEDQRPAVRFPTRPEPQDPKTRAAHTPRLVFTQACGCFQPRSLSLIYCCVFSLKVAPYG